MPLAAAGLLSAQQVPLRTLVRSSPQLRVKPPFTRNSEIQPMSQTERFDPRSKQTFSSVLRGPEAIFVFEKQMQSRPCRHKQADKIKIGEGTKITAR